MITLNEYVGSHRDSPDWTPAREQKATKLLAACAALQTEMEDDGIEFPTNPATGSGVSGQTMADSSSTTTPKAHPTPATSRVRVWICTITRMRLMPAHGQSGPAHLSRLLHRASPRHQVMVLLDQAGAWLGESGVLPVNLNLIWALVSACCLVAGTWYGTGLGEDKEYAKRVSEDEVGIQYRDCREAAL